jgi:hypothetical protein
VRKVGLMLVTVAGMALAGSAVLADSTTPDATAATTPAAQPAPAAAPTSDPDADKMVCRMMDAPTGSRIGVRRECRTQREWDDIRAQAAKDTSKMQENRGIAAPGK